MTRISLDELKTMLSNRILFLDGAMGTMIQRCGLTEDDFRKGRLAGHPVPLLGNNDEMKIKPHEKKRNFNQKNNFGK